MDICAANFTITNYVPFQENIRNITWEGKPGFDFGLNNLPFEGLQAAVEELLQRSQGAAFLAPVLSKLCQQPVSVSEIGKTLKIDFYQEGPDAGIAEVEVEVKHLGPKSFVLNLTKKTESNNLAKQIFSNLLRCWRRNPRYIVKPLLLRDGLLNLQGERLTLFATENKRDYIEVNMQKTEDGKRVVLNQRGKFWEILDPKISTQIAVEMAKIIFLYADTNLGEFLADVSINSGDFIWQSGGNPPLYLVTARKIEKFPVWPNEPVLSLTLVIDRLLGRRELSIIRPKNLSPEEEEKLYALHVFTLEEVLEGLRKALIEMYGDTPKNKGELLKCLGFWLWLNRIDPPRLFSENYQDATLRTLVFLERNGFNSLEAMLCLKQVEEQLSTLPLNLSARAHNWAPWTMPPDAR